MEVRIAGAALNPSATYSVTCNNFLAGGGDNFTAFKEGSNQIGGAVDLDALIDYVKDNGTVATPTGPRIFRR